MRPLPPPNYVHRVLKYMVYAHIFSYFRARRVLWIYASIFCGPHSLGLQCVGGGIPSPNSDLKFLADSTRWLLLNNPGKFLAINGISFECIHESCDAMHHDSNDMMHAMYMIRMT